MAHKITLKIGQQEPVKVSSCGYSLFQPTDQTGKPGGATRGGTIDITKESSDDLSFFEWATSNSVRKDGSITFTKHDGEITMKTLEFKQGFITMYEEECSSTGSKQMMEAFSISAKEIKVGEATIKHDWPE